MEIDRTAEATERVTIRELQRHTSDVLERVEASGQIYVTKHGRTIARIIPPDPAEEQINAAIAAGILDPRALTEPNTGADILRDFKRLPAKPGAKPLSDVVIELREAEGDR